MGIELLGAKVDSVGRLIYSPEPGARKVFFEAVYETPTGKEFLQYRNPASIARLAEILQSKFLDKGREILVDDCVAVIRDLLAVKDPAVIPLPPEPEAEVVDRPRNPDGKFKSEFQDWSEKHGASECAERAKIDADYAGWRRQQYAAQGVQVGLPLAGLPERNAMTDERESLADFVRAYNNAPASQTRPKAGFVVLDSEHRYTAAAFSELLNKSIKIGLI